MKKALALVLALSMLLIVGCSGEKPVGVTATEIKVGTPLAVSGPYAPVGVPFLDGISSYFKMINDQGGVNGRKIVHITQDHEMNVEKGKAAVEKMLNDDQVFALVGHFGTPIVNATLQDIKTKGTPAVYFATGSGQLYSEKAADGHQVIFPVQPVYPMEGRIQAAYAKYYFGASKLGVIYTNDDAGKDLLGGIKSESAKLGVMVVEESIQPGATDATSQVLKMKTENVDMVIYAGMQATYKPVVTAMETQGLIKPVLMSYINADPTRRDDTVANAPTVLARAGVYSTGWVKFSAMETPEFQQFQQAMIANGRDSSVMIGHAWAGWTAAHIFVEGLKRVPQNKVTWDEFIKAMEKAEFQTPFGGTLNYANGARLGVQQLNLAKMDAAAPAGWIPELDEMSGITEISQMSPKQ